MRNTWLAATVLAAVMIAPVPALAVTPMQVAAAAGKASTASLSGTFERDAAASDDVKKAIDHAVSEMNFVMRPVAHGRLEKTNQPYQSVEIAIAGPNVSIKTDDRPAIVTPAAGTAIKWKREDGEVFDVSTALKDKTRVDQTFAAEDGKRVNTFTVSPDGKTLTMTVTVSSSKLPRPLTYKQVYKRTK